MSSLSGKVGDSGAGFAVMFLAGVSFILGYLLLTAFVLLLAAVLMLRSKPAGLVWHWLYIPLQLIGGIILGWFILENTRDIFCLCGIVFSLAVFSYSIFLIVFLPQAKHG